MGKELTRGRNLEGLPLKDSWLVGVTMVRMTNLILGLTKALVPKAGFAVHEWEKAKAPRGRYYTGG